MNNISSIKESRRHQPLYTYCIVYKAMVRHNSEMVVNIKPTFNNQYHRGLSVRKRHNTLQQGGDTIDRCDDSKT